MAKTNFLQLELTESQLTLFLDWQKALNGNNEAGSESNAQKIDTFAENISKTINIYATLEDFPETGEIKRFYIDLATNDCYRWDADTSAYVLIGGSCGEIQQATEEVLGGIHAAEKTAEETVEIKIDPATGKLYGPSGNNPIYEERNSIIGFSDISIIEFSDTADGIRTHAELSEAYLTQYDAVTSGLVLNDVGGIVTNTTLETLSVVYTDSLGVEQTEQLIDNYALVGDAEIYYDTADMSMLYVHNHAVTIELIAAVNAETIANVLTWYNLELTVPIIICDIIGTAPKTSIRVDSLAFSREVTTNERLAEIDTVFNPYVNNIINQILTVAFELNYRGATPIAARYAFPGNFINSPEDPIREGWAFNGWFKDNGTFLEAFGFGTEPVTESMTIYAKWSSVE